MLRYFIPLLALVLLTTIGCTDNLNRRVARDSFVIAEDTMMGVLIDMALMEGYLKTSSLTPKKKSEESTQLYLGILNKHKISSERLDSTFAYYRDHLEEMKGLYDRVKDSLENMEASYHFEADSLDIQD